MVPSSKRFRHWFMLKTLVHALYYGSKNVKIASLSIFTIKGSYKMKRILADILYLP